MPHSFLRFKFNVTAFVDDFMELHPTSFFTHITKLFWFILLVLQGKVSVDLTIPLDSTTIRFYFLDGL